MDRAARSHDDRTRDRIRPASLRAHGSHASRHAPRHRWTRRLPRQGRKDSITPLTKPTAHALRDRLRERGGEPPDPIFPTSRGLPLTRDAIARRLTLYTYLAAANCPTLQTKNVTPHVLRHTAAMRLLHAGVDTTVIALWLGHRSVETTRIYLDADLSIKDRALARTSPTKGKPGRYRPTDKLLTFLEAL